MISLSKTFQVFDATQCEMFNIQLAHSGKFTNMSFCLSLSLFSFPVSDLGPFAKAGAEGAADFSCWGLLLLRKKMPVWQLQLCVLSWEFNFLELVTVVHLASNRFLEGGDTAKKKKREEKILRVKLGRVKHLFLLSFIVFSSPMQPVGVQIFSLLILLWRWHSARLRSCCSQWLDNYLWDDMKRETLK